jgi:Holliday junction resolvasome RuvABC DNA-binding subunit
MIAEVLQRREQVGPQPFAGRRDRRVLRDLRRRQLREPILELQDRLAQLAMPAVSGAPVAEAPADRLRGDLLSALQNLGYHRPQAEKAVDAAFAVVPDASFEQALKAALKELMR